MAGGHDDEKGVITEKMIIKDIIHACPQAETVIKKHLGAAALSVPGSWTESLEFLAAMNDYHTAIILKELNQVCKVTPSKTGHF
jgi:hypothetical protein